MRRPVSFSTTNESTTRLGTRKRLIAIGDIHGCSSALAALLEAVQPTKADLVITLGDYTSRGPDSRGVLEILLVLQQQSNLKPILGNHDEMMCLARKSQTALEQWKYMGGDETLGSYGTNASLADIPQSHWEFLKNCLEYFETDNFVFTHATYEPNWPFDKMQGSTLRWLPLEKPYPGPHYSRKCIIVGHTPQEGKSILDLPHLKCLDTGMGTGGALSAIDLHSGFVWQADQNGNLI